MWKYQIGLLICAGLAMWISPSLAGVEDQFEARELKTDEGTLPYRLLKPKSYDPNSRYPLVLFLHGAGERGNDNKAQLKHVVSIFVQPENREKYPCFVLVPQCPSGRMWAEVDFRAETHKMPEKPSLPMALTIKVIEQLKKEFSIDEDRVYVMGLSMGGYGTWDAIARYPDMFAAAVPMCGGGDETTAPKIARLPIWNFHGQKDPLIKVSRSRSMIEAVRKAGGNPKHTEYPEAGHDCWTPASKEPELLPWLFSQKRSK
jgi:predicted peptidase